MNILLLNWRDPKNPKAGGAEKLNMYILKPFLEKGDSVTWYAKAMKGLPERETYEGIHIVRFGNPLTHLLGFPFFYWLGKFGKVDFLIDSIHGTGYLSSIIAPRTRKKILICEVAQNIWDEMYPFPVNVVGKLWENVMFWFYRHDRFWTISESTKKDLVHFGVPSKQIAILPMGFDAVKLTKLPEKYDEPTALFVGRLAEMKGVKDAIEAIAKVNKSDDKKWKLRIIGRGDRQYESELKTLIKKLEIEHSVEMLGFVSEKEKFEEMAKAWILLVPSSREGWGMIVPEANSVGTPAIGYDVAGLRDVLVRYAKENKGVAPSVQSLAQAISQIKSPVQIKEDIKPGWQELYAFMLNQL
jgi:glycosyltransferase involved in cell wall biosynthesis